MHIGHDHGPGGHDHGHDHSHGHDHGHVKSHVKQGKDAKAKKSSTKISMQEATTKGKKILFNYIIIDGHKVLIVEQ